MGWWDPLNRDILWHEQIQKWMESLLCSTLNLSNWWSNIEPVLSVGIAICQIPMSIETNPPHRYLADCNPKRQYRLYFMFNTPLQDYNPLSDKKSTFIYVSDVLATWAYERHWPFLIWTLTLATWKQQNRRQGSLKTKLCSLTTRLVSSNVKSANCVVK